MNSLRRALVAALCWFAWPMQPSLAQVAAPDDTAFQDFLRGIRDDALARGISTATLDSVLPTIELHRRVVEEDRSQAEFVQTYERYLRRVSPRRIEQGRRLMTDQGAMIAEVAAAYGVQPRFVVAIIGLETDYGTYPLREPLFDVLATLAFDERRSEQFRTELFAALEIVDKGYASVDQMKSSWAGAVGVPQFTPSNVLKLAVDHDRDGRIDLWTVGPDVIASVANYLRDTGWRADQTWGREVRLPAGGEQTLPSAETDTEGLPTDTACQRYQSLHGWRELGDWQTLGVRRVDGRDLPARSLPAALILGDTGDDRGYLVYRNFCSLMRYNPAFRYALSVGLLADAIATEAPR